MSYTKIVRTNKEKTCTRCYELRNYTEYHKNKSRPDGYKDLCKLCSIKERAKNKQKVLDLGKNICACCGEKGKITKDRSNLEVDHIISPKDRESPFVIYRKLLKDFKLLGTKYQILCRKCNRWKANGPICPCHWWDTQSIVWRNYETN